MNTKIKRIVIKNLKPMKKEFSNALTFIPKPKQVSQTNNSICSILDSNCCFLTFNLANSKILLEDLNDFLNQISTINLSISKISKEEETLFNELKDFSLLQEYGEEAYGLEINGNFIMIYGLNEKGVFYGLQTLIQIIKNSYLNDPHLTREHEKSSSFLLPNLQIKDYPDFKMRGIADDIARGQIFSLESAKRYFTILSHYKVNFYFLYLEDMFAHPKHPDIGRNRGALTPEEVKELDAFAKERYITLVPIFQCLGHVDNILIHEKYESLGEFPGAECYDISNHDLYPFLNDYIAELSECFSTNYFHVGCDETFDIGKFRSKKLFEEKGKLALLSHYEKVYQLAREKGNENVIMYDDFIRNDEEILENLNKGIILMYWDYSPKDKYPKVKQLIEKGFNVIVSPSMLNWQRIFPEFKSASINLVNLALEAYEYRNEGCPGIINSNWGDYRYYTLRELEYYGGIMTGAVSWTVQNFDHDSFLKDLGFLHYGLREGTLAKCHALFTSIDELNSFFKVEPAFISISFYMYFFKHPFPSEKISPSIKNYEALGTAAEKCLNLYEELKPRIQFKKDNFEILEFCAQMGKAYSDKLRLSLELSNNLGKIQTNKEMANQFISKIHAMKEKIHILKNQYENLWLKEAKRPCLDHTLELFDFLIKEYEEKADQISKNIWFKDPYLRSEWIWVDEKISPAEPRYFKKTFSLDQPVKEAFLQGCACTHMKIYINNSLAGSVSGRTTFAILPILYRTRVFDITKFLKKGINTIIVEAYNFEFYKGAINLFGQLLLDDGNVQEILTDTSWKGYKEKELTLNQLQDEEFENEKWVQVKSYGRPPSVFGDLFEPNLLNGEKSRTQDYFGIESHEYDLLKRMLGKRGEKKIEKMLEDAYKIMNPFG